ncbi:cadherin domain-containing protein [Ancylomarina sp. YFZ004]
MKKYIRYVPLLLIQLISTFSIKAQEELTPEDFLPLEMNIAIDEKVPVETVYIGFSIIGYDNADCTYEIVYSNFYPCPFEIMGNKLYAKFVLTTVNPLCDTPWSGDIKVTTNDGKSLTKRYYVKINNLPDPPSIVNFRSLNVDEDSKIGMDIAPYFWVLSDCHDPAKLSMLDNEYFEIIDDKIYTKLKLDFEENSFFEFPLTVKAEESGLSTSYNLYVAINDVNEAPTAIQLSNATITENAPIGTEVGTLNASDVDVNQKFTYTIAENENFEIVGDKLISKTAFDFETLDSYSVKVTVADQDGLSHKQNFTIQVTDVNEAPTAIAPSAPTVVEDATYISLDDNIQLVDVDGDDQIVIFNISGGELTIGTAGITFGGSGNGTANVTAAGTLAALNAALDAATFTPTPNLNGTNAGTISFTTNDGEMTSSVTSVIFEITAVNDEPSAVQLSANTITENSTIGTEVGILTASDVDANQIFTYTIAENENFEIAGDKLLSKAALNFETKDYYSAEITVADQDGLSHKQSFTITVEDANDAPTAIELSNTTIAENSVIGTDVGTLSATDEDANQSFTYTIAENANFEIVGDKLVSKSEFDYETKDSYSVEMTVTDQDGLSFIQNFSIAIQDLNDNTPIVLASQIFSVNEDAPNTTSLGTVLAADADAGTIFSSWTISSGNDESVFAIDASTGEITVNDNSNLDFEATTSYTLSVTVSDGMNTSSVETLNINVNDINDNAPIVAVSQVFTIDENLNDNNIFGTIKATDVDRKSEDLKDWIITNGNKNNAFTINPLNGQISVNNSLALDRENTDKFLLEITVSDGELVSEPETITIKLNDLNDNRPVIAANQTFSLDENPAKGIVIGNLAVKDADISETIYRNWTITNFVDLDGNGNNAIAIHPDTGELTVNDPLDFDYETTQNLILQIKVSDGTDFGLEEEVIINIRNLNDNLPTIIGNQSFTVNENIANGTSVGKILATDGDAGTTFSNWNIFGGTDADGIFSIDETSGEIKIADNTYLDAENKPSYLLQIRLSDGDYLSAIGNVTINVADLNDNAPVISEDQVFHIKENSPQGTLLATIEVTDGDITPTSLFTFSWVGGNTNSAFVLDPNTGEIRINNPGVIDCEANSRFDLVFKVSDGTNTSKEETIIVLIDDINEFSPIVNASTFSVDENAENTDLVGQLLASDNDVSATFSDWTITSGNEDAIFSIHTASGEISIADNTKLDFETNISYTLSVTVSDGINTSSVETVSINVKDINEVPSAIQLSNATIAENSAIGIEVGTLTASDVDAGQSFIYTIAENANFEIAGDKLVSKAVFDYENQNSYSVEITVSDQAGLSHKQIFSIDITDANDAPIFTSEAITEGVEAVEYVYTVECMDIDGDAISLLAIEKPDWLNLVDNGDGTCTLSGTPARGGLYHVILEASDSEFTIQQEFDIDVEVITGIEPDFTASTVNIYPNPVANELHIDLSGFKGEELSIALYSLTGKLIFKESYQSIGEEINIRKSLQHLQSGLYLLMIDNDGSRKTYKIVKK